MTTKKVTFEYDQRLLKECMEFLRETVGEGDKAHTRKATLTEVCRELHIDNHEGRLLLGILYIKQKVTLETKSVFIGPGRKMPMTFWVATKGGKVQKLSAKSMEKKQQRKAARGDTPKRRQDPLIKNRLSTSSDTKSYVDAGGKLRVDPKDPFE